MFKKKPSKEQRQEQRRREDLMRHLYVLLVSGCDSAQDMKTRTEVVFHQMDAEGAKKMEAFKKGLGEEVLGTWGLKPQEGKGSKVEEQILDLLSNETVQVAQTILQAWQITHDAFVRKDMLERKPNELKIEFK